MQPWKDEFEMAWKIVDPRDKSLFFRDIIYLQRFLHVNILSLGKEYSEWLADRKPQKGMGYPIKM